MTTTEERRELMEMAMVLQTELKQITSRVHLLTNKLIEASDEMKLISANEISAGESVTKKALTYTGQIDGMGPNITVAPKLAPGKRACSLCREPGHRAQNCPNAHEVQAEKKAEVAARPAKRVHGPVSPERRAQLSAALAKARAARKRR